MLAIISIWVPVLQMVTTWSQTIWCWSIVFLRIYLVPADSRDQHGPQPHLSEQELAETYAPFSLDPGLAQVVVMEMLFLPVPPSPAGPSAALWHLGHVEITHSSSTRSDKCALPSSKTWLLGEQVVHADAWEGGLVTYVGECAGERLQEQGCLLLSSARLSCEGSQALCGLLYWFCMKPGWNKLFFLILAKIQLLKSSMWKQE